MTARPRCAHDPCTCAATEGEYCSDHCREHVGQEVDSCECGHAECAGANPKAAATAKDEPENTVCSNCALIVDEKVERCPRCNAKLEWEHKDALVDKASADSFPASDPPSHWSGERN